jgi:AraC-like DNA-binding protein
MEAAVRIGQRWFPSQSAASGFICQSETPKEPSGPVLDGLQALASQLRGNMLLGTGTALALEILETATTLLRDAYAPASKRIGEKDGPHLAQGGLAGWQVCAITRHIDSHLDEKLSLDGLAAVVRLSQSQLCRAVRCSFQCSPMQYVMQRRLAAAKALLRDDAMPLCDLALHCGFADQAHFTRVFRAATGDTPRRWHRLWRRFAEHSPATGLDRQVRAHPCN